MPRPAGISAALSTELVTSGLTHTATRLESSFSARRVAAASSLLKRHVPTKETSGPRTFCSSWSRYGLRVTLRKTAPSTLASLWALGVTAAPPAACLESALPSTGTSLESSKRKLAARRIAGERVAARPVDHTVLYTSCAVGQAERCGVACPWKRRVPSRPSPRRDTALRRLAPHSAAEAGRPGEALVVAQWWGPGVHPPRAASIRAAAGSIGRACTARAGGGREGGRGCDDDDGEECAAWPWAAQRRWGQDGPAPAPAVTTHHQCGTAPRRRARTRGQPLPTRSAHVTLTAVASRGPAGPSPPPPRVPPLSRRARGGPRGGGCGEEREWACM
eukprot:scaffold198_cov352-Prasinococcus_capsulatus_cf.AAC.5